jgi:hypothetical protein
MMTAHYKVRVRTQQQKRNRNYDLVWYETDVIAVHLDVDAENWEEAKGKAQALLPDLNFGYRYDYWPETVEELKPDLSETVLDELRAGIASLNAGQGIPAKRRIRKTGV